MANKSVMIVDDEAIILSMLAEELRDENFTLTLAGSGEEAIQNLREHSYDLVITDLVMENIDGIQVLKAAKKLYPGICVIILTGHGDMTSAVDALRLGANDYLSKPCLTEDLLKRIHRFI